MSLKWKQRPVVSWSLTPPGPRPCWWCSRCLSDGAWASRCSVRTGPAAEDWSLKTRNRKHKETTTQWMIKRVREWEQRYEDEASDPRNKVDENSSVPTPHYLLGQLRRLTRYRRPSRHWICSQGNKSQMSPANKNVESSRRRRCTWSSSQLDDKQNQSRGFL